jgi:hypothetical protein
MADNMIQILEGLTEQPQYGCAGCGSVNGAALWGMGAAPAITNTSTAVKVAAVAAVFVFVVMPLLRRAGKHRRKGRRSLGGMNPTSRAYGTTVPR